MNSLTFFHRLIILSIWITATIAIMNPLGTASLHAQSRSPSSSPFDEIIPEFAFKKLSLEEAVNEIKTRWETKHPDIPFPYNISHFTPDLAANPYPNQSPLLTVYLRDVSYLQTLKHIADFAGYHFTPHGEKALDVLRASENALTVETMELKPVALKTLNLTIESSRKEVETALKVYGMEFDDKKMAMIVTGGDSMVSVNVSRQQRRLSGLLHLLNQGYKIHPPKNPPTSSGSEVPPDKP